MLGVHPGRLAGFGLALDHVVPPLVARRLKRDRSPGAFVHDHVLHAFAATQSERFVNGGLERDFLAAAHLSIGRDDRDSPGVDNALLQALRREAAEHDRVRRADPRAGLHRGHHLDRHRHIDDDALAFLDAESLQRVRELADPVVELPVGDLRDLAVVRLENDGGLVALRLQVPVEAVVGSVELAIMEPLEERRVRFVENLGKGFVPERVFPRKPAPESLEVPVGLVAQRLVGRGTGHVRLLDEFRGRREQPVLLEHGLDRCVGHLHIPPVEVLILPAPARASQPGSL